MMLCSMGLSCDTFLSRIMRKIANQPLFSDPLNPSFAGCYSDAESVHDMQCVNYNGPDALYSSREICFCCNYDVVLAIVDVTDTSNPITIAVKTYENNQSPHQGSLSYDHNISVFDD